MKYLISILFICLLFNNSCAQDKKIPVYTIAKGIVYKGKTKVEESDYHKIKYLKVGGYGNVSSLEAANIDLKKFPNVVSLDLSFNRFKEIPKELYLLKNLKYLNLVKICAHDDCEGVYVTNFKFPDTFWKLTNLRKLTINNVSTKQMVLLKKKLPECKVIIKN